MNLKKHSKFFNNKKILITGGTGLIGKSLSDQRHFHRSEHWYILEGSVQIITEYNDLKTKVTLTKNSTYNIGDTVWHLSTNIGTVPCHILEVQYGDMCVEEDIERR